MQSQRHGLVCLYGMYSLQNVFFHRHKHVYPYRMCWCSHSPEGKCVKVSRKIGRGLTYVYQAKKEEKTRKRRKKKEKQLRTYLHVQGVREFK